MCNFYGERRARRSEAYEAVVNDDTVRRQSRRETEPQRDPRRAVRYCKFDKQKIDMVVGEGNRLRRNDVASQ